MDWKRYAACAGMNVDMFVPDRRQRPNAADSRREAAAKRVCAICTQRVPCLEAELDAMRDGATSIGVFGGTNARERVAILGYNPHYASHHKRVPA